MHLLVLSYCVVVRTSKLVHFGIVGGLRCELVLLGGALCGFRKCFDEFLKKFQQILELVKGTNFLIIFQMV